MQGATEFAGLFQTGQYGRLYIVAGSHARGATFRIFVLPEGEAAVANGANNPPLNRDAVEVYGVRGGQPGWTEFYGWIHEGPWKRDFEAMVQQRRSEITAEQNRQLQAGGQSEAARRKRQSDLLASYK